MKIVFVTNSLKTERLLVSQLIIVGQKKLLYV